MFVVHNTIDVDSDVDVDHVDKLSAPELSSPAQTGDGMSINSF